MRALGQVNRVADDEPWSDHQAVRRGAPGTLLAHRAFAAIRRIELQHVSFVAGIGLAVVAVFWLSSAQNAAVPASKPALIPTAATSSRAEDNAQVVVYLVGSQVVADATWAAEREAEWVRYDNRVLGGRHVVVFVAETGARQAVIRAAYTGHEVIELGQEIVFFDLTEP